MRINIADLNEIMNRINEVTGNALEAYTKIDGKHTANIGHYMLGGAYGGHQLQKLISSGGAITTPIGGGYYSKKETYYKLESFLAGLHIEKVVAPTVYKMELTSNTYRVVGKHRALYTELESALEIFADDYDLPLKEYQDENGDWIYNKIAKMVLRDIDRAFGHVQNIQQRSVDYLQGLGLAIPYYNNEIHILAYIDGRLFDTDSEKKHDAILERYWYAMASRLKNIAESKN